MTITYIKKRNGAVVEFDRHRIETAVSKACRECDVEVNQEFLSGVADEIVHLLGQRFDEDRMPSVENVQDMVEAILAERGMFKVAKAYIIYRYEHSKQRQEKQKDIIEKIENNDLMVTKRSGQKEAFSLDKLMRSLGYAMKGFEETIDIRAVALQCRSELFDGMSTGDVARALIMTTRALIEQDTAYSTAAARLLLFKLYREVIGADTLDFAKLDAQYRAAFIRNIKRGVEIKRLDPRLLAMDLEGLAAKLVPDRDNLLLYLGVQTLYDRYCLQNPKNKEMLETPQAFWMRVAMGLSINEEQPFERAVEFYNAISSLRFVPSTPTLFHSGMVHPQLSSCYLNTVMDDLHNIFKVIGDNAQLSKWSGGIGTDWTSLRGMGAMIKGIGVESQGVVPFLKVANDMTAAINRSGKRRGAACVYLEVWHYDIESFLELRKNTGDERRRTHDIDTANWIPDLFMKRVRDDGAWTLFSPDETPDLHEIYGRAFEEAYARYERKAAAGEIQLYKTLKARDLWKKMLAMLFETGHPWITWKDPSNVRSPQDHVGVVHNSNLCTEITLNNSEDETAVCNLGWVNFPLHIRDGKFDEQLVKDTVTTGMRMLDNVIDVNFYPTKETKTSNMRHRPVGLGMGGFHDALYLLDINFDSDAAVEFADSSMETVSYYTILASSELAKERGAYPTYRGSKWDRNLLPIDTLDLLEQERGEVIDVSRTVRMDWDKVRASIKEFGMRNSNCLAVAPTATTSNIVGSIPSIEPIYKNIYVKSNQGGDFIVVNPYLVEDLKKLKLWDYEMVGKIKYYDGSIQNIAEIPEKLRAKYKEVFEIDPRWLIKSAAHRGKWIDQSQSLNIFFAGTSGKILDELYFYAWSLGLKTTYYLRTLAASQVEKSTVSTTDFGSTHHRPAATGVFAATPSPTAVPRPVESVAPELVKKESAPEPVKPAPVTPMPPQPLPACKIEDPTCESCQ